VVSHCSDILNSTVFYDNTANPRLNEIVCTNDLSDKEKEGGRFSAPDIEKDIEQHSVNYDSNIE
jgi:hypothetical protein